jgi:hypothetical protein
VPNVNMLAGNLIKNTPGNYAPNYKIRPSLRASATIPIIPKCGDSATQTHRNNSARGIVGALGAEATF